MFEELQAHRQAVREQIQKGFEIGFTDAENGISKAHNVGDVHPNGKWVWTQLPSGRYDWRVIKKQAQTVETPKQEEPKQTPKFTREELHKDYESAEWADNAEKKALAVKYEVQSLKKADIQKEILNQLRNTRKSATSFDTEDVRDFFRLDPGILKIKDYLKEESVAFVKYLKAYEEDYLKKHKLDKWIGIPVSSSIPLSYSDRDRLKRYAKVTEYLAEAEPRPLTAKDKEFNLLVDKFTGLLADYKKEYLSRVRDYARERYNKTLPNRLQRLRDTYADLKAESSKLDWRTDKAAYDKNYDARRKVANHIDDIDKFYRKYAKLTDYIADCEKNATEEFEDNVRTLSARIVKEGLAVDKLVVKSVHDDPKVFNMKITDGTKNLYCRSILAAMYSTYMIPHYRFIITNRKDEDGK